MSTLAAILEDGRSCAEDDATILCRALSEMKVLLCGLDSRLDFLSFRFLSCILLSKPS